MSSREHVVLALGASLATALAPAASASDLWVDASADCAAGNGSAAFPFCTITAAVGVAGAGDTIHVAPGSYDDVLSLYGAALHFVADQGALVTILTTGQPGARPLTLNSGCDVTFEGFAFANNGSPVGGAAAISDSAARFVDCVFDGNAAANAGSGAGGALYVSNSAVTLERTTLRGNSAEAQGGAISAQSQSSIVATDCLFEQNEAASGEALFLRSAGSTLSMTGCTVQDHAALAAGALGVIGSGLYLEDGVTTLADCSFARNEAVTFGGALYLGVPATLTAARCVFDSNAAGAAGGAVMADGVLALEGCAFTANRARADSFNFGSGGALAYAAYLGVGTLEGCTFEGNVAEGASLSGGGGRGGAIHAAGGLALARCRFAGNRADGPADSGRGGALFVSVGDSALDDCELATNVADSSAAGVGGIGGAIDVWPGSASATLARCTVAGNVASAALGAPASGGTGGGIASAGSATVTLTSTIVAGNLAAAPAGAPDLDGSATSGGWNLLGDSTGATLVGGSNDLLDVDPLFVDPLLGDFSLEVASPAVDSCDASFWSTESDVAGFPRVLDADFDRAMRLDRGAREFCHVHLAWSGSATPGGTITIDSTGTAGLHAFLVAGVSTSALKLKPFGALWVDLSPGSLVLPWLDLPSSVDVDLDPSIPVPFTILAQELAYGSRVGNVSNLLVIPIE